MGESLCQNLISTSGDDIFFVNYEILSFFRKKSKNFPHVEGWYLISKNDANRYYTFRLSNFSIFNIEKLSDRIAESVRIPKKSIFQGNMKSKNDTSEKEASINVVISNEYVYWGEQLYDIYP